MSSLAAISTGASPASQTPASEEEASGVIFHTAGTATASLSSIAPAHAAGSDGGTPFSLGVPTPRAADAPTADFQTGSGLSTPRKADSPGFHPGAPLPTPTAGAAQPEEEAADPHADKPGSGRNSPTGSNPTTPPRRPSDDASGSAASAAAAAGARLVEENLDHEGGTSLLPPPASRYAAAAAAAAMQTAAGAARVSGSVPLVVTLSPPIMLTDLDRGRGAANPNSATPPSSRRWVPAFVARFFSFLLEIICCRCFYRNRNLNTGSTNPGGASGIILRGSQQTASAAPAAAAPPKTAIEEQLDFAIAAEIESWNNAWTSGRAPAEQVKKVMLCDLDGVLSEGEELFTTTNHDTYGREIRDLFLSGASVNAARTFTIGFITLWQEGGVLQCSIETYSYLPHSAKNMPHHFPKETPATGEEFLAACRLNQVYRGIKEDDFNMDVAKDEEIE